MIKNKTDSLPAELSNALENAYDDGASDGQNLLALQNQVRAYNQSHGTAFDPEDTTLRVLCSTTN